MATPALSEDELRSALTTLPQWEGNAATLVRTFTAPDFLTGVDLVRSVAQVAEELDHHPDIDIRWRTLRFALSTHDAGGRVTAKDVDLAHRIEALLT